MSLSLPSIKPLLSRLDADALVALNDALQYTPEAKLRDVLRSVCLSNPDVAAVLHGALCSKSDDIAGAQGLRNGGAERLKHEEGGKDDDEGRDDNYEERHEDNDISNDRNDGTHVPVLGLTEPDADKENAVTGENRQIDTTGNSNTQGRKRKASNDDDDNVEFLYCKKVKQDFNPMPATSSIAYPIATNIERYKSCSNCSRRFDVTDPPCHDHKAGPKRTPGRRDRVCGEGYIGGDSTEDEDEYEDAIRKPCDCTYHSGTLRDHEDNGSWAGEGRSQVVGHIDWWRRGSSADQVWDCCDQEAFAKGCKMGRHQAGSDLLPYAAWKVPNRGLGVDG